MKLELSLSMQFVVKQWTEHGGCFGNCFQFPIQVIGLYNTAALLIRLIRSEVCELCNITEWVIMYDWCIIIKNYAKIILFMAWYTTLDELTIQ